MLYAIVGVLFLLADQALKLWTVSNVDLNTGISKLIPGFLHITHIKNFGALFGILKNAGWLRWAALLLLIAFAVGMLLCLRRGVLRTGLARWSGALLLAGLIGNGLDRALFGYVVDMIEFEFGRLPIFNLADMLILLAGIAFFVSIILGGADFSAFAGEVEEEPMPRRRGEDYGREERPRRREDEYDRPVRRAPAEEAPRRRVDPAASNAQPRQRRMIDEDSLPVPDRSRRTTPENIAEQPIRTRRNVEAQSEVAPRQRRVIDENSLPVPDRSRRPVEGEQPMRQRPVQQTEQAVRQRPVQQTEQTVRQRPAQQTEQAVRQRPAQQTEQAVRQRPAAPAPRAAAPQSDAPARKSTLDMDLDSILAEFDD